MSLPQPTYEPLPDVRVLQALSYGGGRQTAGMLALIGLGEIPKPEVIVFADTGGELPETYAHIEQWAKPYAESLDVLFRVVRYTVRGQPWTLYDYSYKYRWLPQPWQRMCSSKFKITAIERYLRPFKPVAVWLGISVEESWRRRPSPTKWITNVYPLIDRGLTIHDCIAALHQVGAPEPPKSACFYCPFQSLVRWRLLQSRHFDLFQKAVALEEHAREKNSRVTLTGRQPLRVYLEGEQGAWEELLQGEAGCMTGHCFV